MISRENVRCAILLVKESLHAVPCAVLKRVFRSLLQRKLSFTEQVSYLSIAKSDEIGKIAHLAFSLEIMGADILEKLSLTNESLLLCPILSLLATLGYDTCFVKLPLALKPCLWGHAATRGTLFNKEKCQFLCVSPH